MKKEDKPDEEVVCEFFGIQITTRNPNIARVLTSEVSEVAGLDVAEVKDFLIGDSDEDEDLKESDSNQSEPDS